jgi:nitrate reductase delta subunit
MGATKTPKPMSLTLRVLARLLSYPDAALREHLDELRQALRHEAALQPARQAEIEALIDSIATQGALDAEADYVQLFDSGRRTSLHLFEHVHGDSRDRGPAMIDLAQTFEAAGLYLDEGEMPDHLPVVLEYASTQPQREAQALLAEMAHIFNVIFSALDKRRSRYASAVGALIELAGEKAAPVNLPDEAPIDESWTEPAAFDGCSSAGQSRPGQPQPIQIVRPSHSPAAPGVRP